jgi:hypothetical protein
MITINKQNTAWWTMSRARIAILIWTTTQDCWIFIFQHFCTFLWTYQLYLWKLTYNSKYANRIYRGLQYLYTEKGRYKVYLGNEMRQWQKRIYWPASVGVGSSASASWGNRCSRRWDTCLASATLTTTCLVWPTSSPVSQQHYFTANLPKYWKKLWLCPEISRLLF